MLIPLTQVGTDMSQNPVPAIRAAVKDDWASAPIYRVLFDRVRRDRRYRISVALLGGQWAVTLCLQGFWGTSWADVLLGASSATTVIVGLQMATGRRFVDWLRED